MGATFAYRILCANEKCDLVVFKQGGGWGFEVKEQFSALPEYKTHQCAYWAAINWIEENVGKVEFVIVKPK